MSEFKEEFYWIKKPDGSKTIVALDDNVWYYLGSEIEHGYLPDAWEVLGEVAMASYKLITTEDEKYISEFMDWLQENITPAQVNQETFANNIMNISNIMKFGSGGIDTSDAKAALPIDIVSKRSELLKAEDSDCSFNEYLQKHYKEPELEITYKDKNRGETITEKALIRQYKRAFRL